VAEHFSGRVTSVVFANEAQSFYVLRVKLDAADDGGWIDTSRFVASTVVVKGTIPGLTMDSGSWFGFEGKWITHPEYGRQLEIVRAPVLNGPWTPENAIKILSSHGIGQFTCQRIADHFGDGLIEALSDDAKLAEVNGLTEFDALHISSRWRAVRAMFQTLTFLSDLKLPKTKVDQVWAKFGDDAEQILAENPWRLTEIDGITFKQADEVAKKMGLDLNSPYRLKGAMLASVKTQRGMGHLYMTSGEVLATTQQLVYDATVQDVAVAIKECHLEGSLVLDRETRPGTTAIYEPWLHRVEVESAIELAERHETARLTEDQILSYTKMLGSVGKKTMEVAEAHPSDIEVVAQSAIAEWSSTSKLTLSASQMKGGVNALIHPVSIITGLPGTGKTTLLKTVVKVLQDAEVPFLLVAPTGIAAKRVMSVTGAEASTIHRAFQASGMDMDDDREATYAGIVGHSADDVGADGSDEVWGYSSHNPHPAEVVIVDESSMVDQHVLYRLLSCTSKKCRLVFVGDAAQLPSVGPGNVLRDLIECGEFPVTDLREIFRQEDTSDIVTAAHAIHAGVVPEVGKKGSDFTLIEMRNDADILAAILKAVSKLYAAHANFQVLSPRHAGTLGVTNLNSRIREVLNPKSPGVQEMRLGSETIREGDRVMVVKNNYRYDIFNGDVGKVMNLDRKEKEVSVKIHGPPSVTVRLPFKEAPSHLRLAYTMTVHKSQGQEYDTILLPWVTSFSRQLQRNLIYTGITRARKKVVLFGQTRALAKAIANNKVDARNTLFPDRLGALIGAHGEPSE